MDTKKVHRKEKKERKKEKKQKKEKSLEKLQYFPTKQVSDEEVEKSCLTEEVHVGYLSDGSQNSKKRSREASPVVESLIKATSVAGNPLRLRIVYKKPKEAEVVAPQEACVCSTSGSESPIQIPSSVSVPEQNLLSTSIESDNIVISSESKKRKKHHKPSKETRYNTLIDVSGPLCFSLVDEDSSNCDDWLVGTRRQESTSTKAIKNNEDVVMNLQSSVDSCSFPRAQFLSDVGVYSLPYTVLF